MSQDQDDTRIEAIDERLRLPGLTSIDLERMRELTDLEARMDRERWDPRRLPTMLWYRRRYG